MLESRKVATRADLARLFGISRARVTQILRLLKLDPEVIESLAILGDPLPSPMITEHQLRSLVNLALEEQQHWLGSMERPFFKEKTSE